MKPLTHIHRRQPELIHLLEAVAQGRADLSLEPFGARTIAWAIETGLGPIFFHAVKDRTDNFRSPHYASLKAADLTARVIAGEQTEAMTDILDGFEGSLVPPLLLKGISIAQEYYPEPHLRIMRDLDFLVPRESLPRVKAMLERLGYHESGASTMDYDEHHHAAPFFHPVKNVWVEVHHGLFSRMRRASRARIFQLDAVMAQSSPGQFCGRPVRRLSKELQLVYLAAHWAQDFQRVGGMVALIDAIYLLKSGAEELDWEWIARSVRGSVAATGLHLLLTYLERHRLVAISAGARRELSAAQPVLRRAGLATACALIDRYYVRGVLPTRFSNKGLLLLWQSFIARRPVSRGVAGSASESSASAHLPWIFSRRRAL